MLDGILRPASTGSETVRLTPEVASTLRKCDRTRNFRECGWTVVMGWQGDKLKVAAHCGSDDELERMMNPDKFRAQQLDAARTSDDQL